MFDCTGEEIFLRIQVNTVEFIQSWYMMWLIFHGYAIYHRPVYAKRRSDRPLPKPKNAVNFGFISQFVEIPRDTVFTVEYSVRAANGGLCSCNIKRKIPKLTDMTQAVDFSQNRQKGLSRRDRNSVVKIAQEVQFLQTRQTSRGICGGCRNWLFNQGQDLSEITNYIQQLQQISLQNIRASQQCQQILNATFVFKYKNKYSLKYYQTLMQLSTTQTIETNNLK
ncbi:Myosin-cross-reactive_antigen [Hexamita inflata]|uniref:Putative n=1 Tax=Hexamita inflata TaxID=28002 RepID=A0AA86PPJ3_9EUKA|nr:Myosin-cross-reactive antigen [Hexamita inflata]